jgi:hypothetical protein
MLFKVRRDVRLRHARLADSTGGNLDAYREELVSYNIKNAG